MTGDRSAYFSERWRDRADVRQASYLRGKARNTATRALIEAHREEYDRLYHEALRVEGMET